jgi:photoactive yellow protein
MTQTSTKIPAFEDAYLAESVETLPPEIVHALPFGAIRLDAGGRVIFYSDTERRQSGYRSEVMGHDFFTDIAPCMSNPNFRGRIDRALAAGKLDISFGYVVEVASGEMDLDVRVQSSASGGCWIFLRRPA